MAQVLLLQFGQQLIQEHVSVQLQDQHAVELYAGVLRFAAYVACSVRSCSGQRRLIQPE